MAAWTALRLPSGVLPKGRDWPKSLHSQESGAAPERYAANRRRAGQAGVSPMVERFKGKIVIVTGSASGIGEAAARRFVAEGAKVALVDCNKDALEKVARSLPADQILVQAVDVSDSSAVDGLVAAVVDRFGRLDVIVNNAGVQEGGD